MICRESESEDDGGKGEDGVKKYLQRNTKLLEKQ